MTGSRPFRSISDPRPVLVWFRHDLRLADNPALSGAVKIGPIVPVFIWAPEEESPWEPGAASRWWLHHSLASLSAALAERGLKLILRKGASASTLRHLAKETGAQAVIWNRRYEPAVRVRDEKISEELNREGIACESYNAALLHEPWSIHNKSGGPFKVFTPFWRHCLSLPAPGLPLKAPAQLARPRSWPCSLRLEELELEPKHNWADGLAENWYPGEKGAGKQLQAFETQRLANYNDARDRPAVTGTSRLSPHLHFGEISPRQVWYAAAGDLVSSKIPGKNARFLTELGWREFAHHLMHHFPDSPSQPLRPEFKTFRWRNNPEWLRAWTKGETGIPLVDAGMRELWHTGWMHNRVRMVVASFLVKNLLISWTEGARWFWDTLVDADLAQNTLGWQWTAGCGADAAPFFRVFNPVLQGEKFDPQGAYVRRWVPELGRLGDRWVHRPFEAPREDLTRAGITLGKTYPLPLVSLAVSREVALEAYGRLRGA